MAATADLLTTIRAEIDARLSELRPLLAEYERLLTAADALVVKIDEEPVSPPARPVTAPSRAARKSARSAPRGPGRPGRPRAARAEDDATGRAIVAALEHGSHTLAELVVVTALGAPDLRDSLRRLLSVQAIVKTGREGKTAYALASAAAA